MTVGGLRARFVYDSFVAHITAELELLGWFDPNRAHAPIQVVTDPDSWAEPIAVNSLAFTVAGANEMEVEVGSLGTEASVLVVAALYAETFSLGTHLMADVRDIARGRLGSTGTDTFTIFDYLQATPTSIGYGWVTDVRVLRSSSQLITDWKRHWFSVECEIHDIYYPQPTDAYPGVDTFPSDSLFPTG